MRHGVRGLVKPGAEGLLDLTQIDKAKLEAVARTPSAALGSTRDKPDEAYCDKILDGCRRNDIRYFFYIGGNDSADTCRIVSEKAADAGYELRCFHVPKTIDNDLLENDHTPGFPSAARYVSLALMGDALDNASLGGIKINVIMGRNAGFLAAAAAIARGAAPDGAAPQDRPAPHLIYLPEVPFSTDAFLADVEAVYAKLGRCQIAVSEGIRDASGAEIGPKLMRGPGEVDAHGNVQLSGSGALGDGLADLVKTGLTPKGGKAPRVRADTFGYIQRCWPHASPVDSEEARAVGRYAAELAARGDVSASVIIRPPRRCARRLVSECARADLVGGGAAHAACAGRVHLRQQRRERGVLRLLPAARGRFAEARAALTASFDQLADIGRQGKGGDMDVGAPIARREGCRPSRSGARSSAACDA